MNRSEGRGTADAAVGMMDGAYFTSRRDIIDFFNDLLQMSLTKIEQTATGAVACQLMEYIFPKSIPMSRVNWEAKMSHEFVGNYKLLQAAFDRNRIQKHVDVDRLIRAKYQDNLEFCQWLKAFHDQRASGGAGGGREGEYDALAVRERGRGGKKLDAIYLPGGGGGGGRRSSVKSSSRSGGMRVGKGGGSGNAGGPAASSFSSSGPKTPSASSVSSSSSMTTSRQKENRRPHIGSSSSSAATMSTTTTSAGGGGGGRNKPPGGVTRNSSDRIVADASLLKRNADLQSRNAELELTLKGIEQERDFYFEKLRGIEVMLQVHEERGKHGSDPDVLVKRVFQVLYATSDDKIVVTDEGEVLGGGDNGDEEGGAVHEQEGDDDNEHLDNEVHEEEEFHESNQSSSGTANAGGPEELMEKEFMNHGHNRPPSPEEELLTEF